MASSIREIAHKTGLSTATVSMALRGAGRISPATRERVKKAAAALDYEASPLLSKALSLARQPRANRYRETLAFLTEFSLDDPHLDPYPTYQRNMYIGALERAKSLGYKLESMTISGNPSEHRRLSRVLEARGIRGLIVIPRVFSNQPRLYFKWANFATVEIGRTLWHPRNLHHVETSEYNKLIEALHVLKRAGYRRIGMAIEPDQNKHQRGTYFAVYLLSQLRQPERRRIPIAAATGDWNEQTFMLWLRQYRPDVLIIHDEKTVPRWLQNAGMEVPRDISLFYVNAQKDHFSGLQRDYHTIGSQSVEMVSLLLESGNLGIETHPRCWQVDEIWQEGSTLKYAIGPHISQEILSKASLPT